MIEEQAQLLLDPMMKLGRSLYMAFTKVLVVISVTASHDPFQTLGPPSLESVEL